MIHENKLALITGGSRGIGKAIVKEFLNHNFTVVFTGTTADSIDSFMKNMNGVPKNLIGVSCNITSISDIESLKKKVESFGRLDVLVNNAGVFTPDTFVNGDENLLRDLMEVNVFGTYRVSQAVLPFMLKTPRSHIFNICSVAGKKAYPNGCSYSVSKFAMDGLGKSMRLELKEEGVRVTNVYPGATLTDSWAGTELSEDRFMKASDVASSIFNAYSINQNSVVEDIVIRPVLGDI